MNNAVLENELQLIDPASNKPISVYFENITPEMAASILNKNHKNNRPVKPKTVSNYVNQMEKGLWKSASGECIKITENGTLVDGQHRLNAIVEHGKPVVMMVISGVPEDAILAIDDGIKRTLSDAFVIKGSRMKNLSIMCSALTATYKLHRLTVTDTTLGQYNAVIKENTLTMMDFHKNLKNFNNTAIHFFENYHYQNVFNVMPGSVVISMYYLFNDLEPEIVFAIFKSIETGIPFDDKGVKSPCYHLVRSIQRRKEMDIRIQTSDYVNIFTWCYQMMVKDKEVLRMPSTFAGWWDENNFEHATKVKAKLKRM